MPAPLLVRRCIGDGMMPTGGASGLLLFFRDSAFILGKGNNILEIMLP